MFVKCDSITCISDSRRGFGLDIGFIDHFNTQLVITLHYSGIADFRILPVTPAHATSFPACSVFARRFLATDSINGYFSEQQLPSNCSKFLLQLFL
jgi:hypothetical protein